MKALGIAMIAIPVVGYFVMILVVSGLDVMLQVMAVWVLIVLAATFIIGGAVILSKARE